MTTALRPTLARPRTVVVGGVCAGLARHLGWGIRRTRALAVLLALFGGGGVLLYAWLWALVALDAAESDDAAAVRRSAPVAALLSAIAAVATLVLLLIAWNPDDTATTSALLTVAVASVAAVAWTLGLDRHDPGRTPRYTLANRILPVVFLLVAGVGVLLSRASALNAVVGVGMVVLGVGVVVAPRVVTLWSDLMAERSTRVREEQRAEIAAHLHDSVLQTLALIQNRAGASSEVARIARAQERELREWLFVGDAPVAADLSAELRDAAAAIELDYPVRIEVVATGESVPGGSVPGTAGLVAASREAMLNAARHVGGEVSVYLETSSSTIDVFVRDRGAGVDLDTLPADRLGIRESIIGRMSRAGGTATVSPGAGGTGTEVHLHLEAQQ